VHRPVPDGPPVVWWDPGCLVLDAEEPLPLRHQQLLEAGSVDAAASEANYAAWLEEGRALRSRGSEPSLSVRTITSLARVAGDRKDALSADQTADQDERNPVLVDPKVEVIVSSRLVESRPGGRRFGALVHAMLASIELDADDDAIHASAAVQGRMFDATPEEIEAAIATVAAALQHLVLRQAAGNRVRSDLRRETPVLLTMPDGTLAEGVLDLAFREQSADFNGWTVVDFKTDQEFSTESAHYMTQVSLYARAVQAATGLPARGIILVI